MKKTQGLVALMMLVLGTNIYAADATEAAAGTTEQVASAETADAASSGIGEQAQAPAAEPATVDRTDGSESVNAVASADAPSGDATVAVTEEPKSEEAAKPKKKKRKKSRRKSKSSCTANSCYKSWPSHMEQALAAQNSFRSVQESCRAPLGQVCTTKTVVKDCGSDCGTPANACETSACAN